MGFLKAVIVKDLRRRLRDPWVLALWLGIPLVIGGLITAMTGGSDSPTPTAHLLVADEDSSLVSDILVNSFRSGPMQDMVSVETVRRAQGESMISDGDGSALLIIPKGFGAAVLAERETELRLIKNPAQVILPRILEQALQLLVDAGFYLHRILGPDLLQQIRDLDASGGGAQALSQIDFTKIGGALNQLAAKLTPYVTPPVVSLSINLEQVEQARELSRNAAFLIFPGMLLMAVMFTAQGISEDYWKERELGTLRRVATTPHSLTRHLIGKVCAGLILLSAVCLLLLVIGFIYHKLPASRMPLALLWLTLGGLVFINLMGLIKIFAPSRRAGALIATLLIFPLMMVGGSFFPSEAMPGWMAAIGRWTPNGYVVEKLKLVLLDRHDPLTMVLDGLGFIGVSLLLFFAALRRHDRIFGRT